MTNRLKEKMLVLCQDLKNSETVRKQNFTSIAENKGGKIVTYCALGALACEKNVVKVVKDEWDSWEVQNPDEQAILQLYGISPKLKREVSISYYNKGKKKNGYNHKSYKNLSNVITSLNDDGHWTFTEIAEYLWHLYQTQAIKECSKAEIKQAEKCLVKFG